MDSSAEFPVERGLACGVEMFHYVHVWEKDEMWFPCAGIFCKASISKESTQARAAKPPNHGCQGENSTGSLILDTVLAKFESSKKAMTVK